jgi:hypothetical protein
MQELQGDVALEHHVEGAVDRTHPPFADPF